MGPGPVVRTSAAAQHPDSRVVRPGPTAAGDDGEIVDRTDAAFRPAEIVMASDGGIDWADAGIGAFVTLASIVARGRRP
jgi:hypothetical protein